MKVIVAEKPSVAASFAKILGVTTRKQGCFENSEWIITWCVGHLVSLCYPHEYDEKYKRWQFETLPFLPSNYKYKVLDNVKDQFKVVKSVLQNPAVSVIYNAGDSAREGELIQRLVYEMAGVAGKKTIMRIWIDSQTDEEMLRGLREAKPDTGWYDNLYDAGKLRQIEDYAMGINFSRALSIRYGAVLARAAGMDHTAIAIGRVMTCLLGMIVDRERSIRDFVETPFYKVADTITVGNTAIELGWKAVEGSDYFKSDLLYGDNGVGFIKRESAKELIAKNQNFPTIIENVEQKTEKKFAPLLFNLAELQNECSKRFKISPDETLQIAQTLYEKKLTTYPRTDARVLSSAVAEAKEITKNINGIQRYMPCAAYAGRIITEQLYNGLSNTRYVDDSKVSDHYAIIPTGQGFEAMGSITPTEKQVYELITRRFLAIFFPPAEYKKCLITAKTGNEKYFTSSTIKVKNGYLEVYENEQKGSSEGNLAVLEALTKGSSHTTSLSVKEGKTSPPRHFDSGNIVLAMEAAGNLIEDETLREQIKGNGIGTSSTRAEVLSKLIKINYITLNKKTQIIGVSALGEMVYEIVKATIKDMLSPKMTASWEKGLSGVADGNVSYEDYFQKLNNFVSVKTNGVKNNDCTDYICQQIMPYAVKKDFQTAPATGGTYEKEKLGASCPVCGGELVSTPYGWGCSNYKKDGTGCYFSFGTKLCGKEISKTQILKIFKSGQTDEIKGFKKKDGTAFNARLCIADGTDKNGVTKKMLSFCRKPQTS